MSSAENDRAFPAGPLSLFEKLGDPIVVGQVAMATDHGGPRPDRTGGAGTPVDGRPSGLPMDDGRTEGKGRSGPGVEQLGGDASGSASKGAASILSNCCSKYYS